MVARFIAGVTGAMVLLVGLVAVLATAAGGDVRAEVIIDTVDGLPTARGVADAADEQTATAEADTGEAAVGGADGDAARTLLSQPTDMPIAFSLVGFAVPDGATVAFRYRDGGGAWSDWTAARVDAREGPAARDHADGEQPVTTRAVWTGAADQLQLRVTGATPADVQINLVDSLGQNRRATQRLADLGQAVARAVTEVGQAPARAATRPDITTRAEWGAQPSGAPSYAGSARGAVLHHTVTSNSYAPSQGPAVVRAIQSYHQNHNGWKDIGYNFLVDRYGRIYQGRAGDYTRPIVGAHAAGHNTASLGVAFIGQHHSGSAGYQPLGQDAAGAAAELLAWLFEIHGINPRTAATLPSGYTFQQFVHRIIGHGHLGGTSCPGSSVNAALAGIREDVVALHEGRSPANDAGGGADTADDHAAVSRLAGDTRQATAARVSRQAFDAAETVVIASATDYPDALAGAGLAGRRDAPVLLTTPTQLDTPTAKEIQRLGASKAIVLGSPTAVSHHVTADLADLGLAVERIAGADRFATAAAVAKRLADAESVLITDGAGGWPDAVSASQLAAREGTPVLLTAGTRVPRATHQALQAINPDDIIIIGGWGTVPPEVSLAIKRYGQLTRLAGPDRVHTAAHVTNLMAHTGADKQRLWLASAGGWPDALAAGPAAAHVGGVLQLTYPGRFEAEGPVGRRVRAARALRLVGGDNAITPMVEHQSVTLIGR